MERFLLTITFLFGKMSPMKTNTQKKIAAEIGVSESQLSRILSGKRKASPAIAERLSNLTSSDFKMWLFNSERNILTRKKILKSKLKELKEHKIDVRRRSND